MSRNQAPRSAPAQSRTRAASGEAASSSASRAIRLLLIAAAIALHVTGPRYHLGTPAVGSLALVGAGSMLATPRAGRVAGRLGPNAVNLRAALAILAAAAALLLGAVGGVVGLLGLGVGMLALDVAVQSGQVANQARIFALGVVASGAIALARFHGPAKPSRPASPLSDYASPAGRPR